MCADITKAEKVVNPRIVHAAKRLRAGLPVAKRNAAIDAIAKRYGVEHFGDLPASKLDAVLADFHVELPLHLATIGPVLPLIANTKRPAIKEWQKEATRDPAKLREFARQFPDCNWGITANVVDIDAAVKPGNTQSGLATFNPLVIDNGEPDTLAAKTPSGGLHFYVADDLPNGSNTLGIGIDSRAAGKGYVVAPGSYVEKSEVERVGVSGFYEWSNQKPVKSVPWLKAAPGHKPSPDRGDALKQQPPRIEPETLARCLTGLDPARFREQEAWFRLMCSCHDATSGQGLHEFRDWSLSDSGYTGKNDDIEHRWSSLNVHAKGDLAMESPGGLIDCLQKAGRNDLAALCVSDFNDVDEAAEIIEFEKLRAAKSAKRRNRLVGRSFTELESLADPTWIVRDMVPDNGLIVLYGKPKRGKSFIALDLSLCVASGAPFHGEEVGRTGRVLYIAAEGGAAAVRNRVKAWLKANNVDPKKLAGNWFLVDTGIALNDPKSVKEFLAANPGKFAMVIIDTLARNTRGDESSAKDMSEAIKGCDAIKEATGATVVLVHHEGWSQKRIRGSSVLQGAPDAIIRVARDSGDMTTMVAEDMRESASGKSLVFTLGEDGVMHMVSSEAAARSRATDRVLGILCELYDASEHKPVPLAKWRDLAKAAGVIDDGSTGRSQWKRTLDTLMERKRIKKGKGDCYSPVVRRDDLIDDYDEHAAAVSDFADDDADDADDAGFTVH